MSDVNNKSSSEKDQSSAAAEGSPTQSNNSDFQQKLAKLQQLDGFAQQMQQPERLTRLQAITENVKEILKHSVGSENPLEVDSRTDIKRYLKVANTQAGEKLVVNTDTYQPGRWFRRGQWRSIESDDDEFFLRSANSRTSRKQE